MPRAVIPNPVLVPNGPDLDGWREAQDRLRLALGQDIVFRVVIPAIYGATVAIDPELGEPYDPTQVPISGGGYTEFTRRVTVIFEPVRVRHLVAAVSSTAVGLERDDGVALLGAASDQADFESAEFFVLNGIEYRIQDAIPDGLGGTTRIVVYGEPR